MSNASAILKHSLFLILLLTAFITSSLVKISAQTAAFSVGDGSTQYCVNDTIFFYNESDNYHYVYWNFDDSYDTYTENPKHIYTQAGQYQVELTAYSNQGGSNKAALTLTIHPLPEFNLEPAEDTIYTSQTKLTITASGDFDTALWSDGSQGQTYTSDESGRHFVTVTKDETGCPNTKEFWIFFTGSGSDGSGISLKNNVITPNNDGLNDVLYIQDISEISPCEIFIYNAFGKLLYQNKNYQNNWKGQNIQDQTLPAGTYYFLIKAAGMPDKTGFIDILR